MNTILIIGIAIIFGIASAKTMGKIHFPSVVGWLFVGIILGPSLLNIFNPDLLEQLGFISDITLGLIALLIGLELTLPTLRKLGGGIVAIIFAESFGAFFLVATAIYLLTHNFPLALLFGAMAPASAPAGTVAVLQEYKARGPLTSALLTVVGADDALAIMIFVFANGLAKASLAHQSLSIITLFGKPIIEILLALGIGSVIGYFFTIIFRKTRAIETLLPAVIGTVFVCIGLAKYLHISLILSNMMIGVVIVNLRPGLGKRISDNLNWLMPSFYIIFFVLAGAHLKLGLLTKLGLIGIIYMVCRTVGLMGGAWLGAVIGKEPPVIRKYLGLGILSQAGVAVGLAYLVIRELAPFGEQGQNMGSLIISVVAATTVVFEIIGPITTKFAISKAGEIKKLHGK